MNTFNKITYTLLLLSTLFLFSSCGGDDEANDPCNEIELNGNSLELNGETYEISEYSYSDLIILNHNFRFTAYDGSCADSVQIALDFSHSVSFPDFSLVGDYSTQFTTNVLELELEEMSGSFQLGGQPRQYITSFGTASISEASATTYRIEVDANTSSLTGSSTDLIGLNVVVPKP